MTLKSVAQAVLVLLGVGASELTSGGSHAQAAAGSAEAPVSATTPKEMTHRACGAAGADPCLLLTYEIRTPLRRQGDVWFVESDGVQFSYSASPAGQDILAKALYSGTVTSKDVAALVANSHRIGLPISRREMRNVASWLAKSRRGPVQEDLSRCKDGSDIIVRGFWYSSEARAYRFAILLDLHCSGIVFENQSSEAHQIVQWVYDHAGKVTDYGPPVIVPWLKTPSAHP